MRDIILDIYNKYPRNYTQIIRANKDIMQWIEENTLTHTANLLTQIYSAVYQASTTCSYGNEKKVRNFKEGIIGCGLIQHCQCTRDKQSISQLNRGDSPEKKRATQLKREATMVATYGVKYNLHREDVKNTLRKTKIKDTAIVEQLLDYAWMFEEYETKKRSSVDIAAELGIYYGTVIDYCKKHGFKIRQRSSYSMVERAVVEYLKSFNIEIIEGDWDILGNKELDIYLPEYKLAIEINGLYWHSYHPKMHDGENRIRHLEKTLLCEKVGITLMHITDEEWLNKGDIIKSIIASKLHKNHRIFARKCTIKTLSTDEARIFFDENHLQGFIAASHYYGLYYNDDLVEAISAGTGRFENSPITELYRLCSKKGINVIGGGSKLLSHLKRIVGDDIYTYCDRDKSTGSGYLNMGFILVKHTKPGYFWTNGTKVISRYRCQKSNLSSWLKNFDPEKSEAENMFENNYRRFWNCGNFLFKI